MTSTLNPDFLVSTLHIQGYKHAFVRRIQGALLTMALNGPTNAALLPAELLVDPLTNKPSRYISGAATGILVATRLLEVVGRIPSPNKSAKGRRVDVLAIPDGRRGTVLTWLARNGFPAPQPQMTLGLSA